jgi:hypothetical protein
MKETAEPKHSWVVATIVREALQQVFAPKDVVLEQLASNSPFLDLVVEEQLMLADPTRCREKHIEAQRRAIKLIPQARLYHGSRSSCTAVKAFIETTRRLLQPHGLTSSVSVTSS